MIPSKLKLYMEKFIKISLKVKGILNDWWSKQANSKVWKQKRQSTIAFCEIAQLIAQKGKPDSIVEALIAPACHIMVKCMFGKDAEVETNNIFANDTIGPRIIHMSENIETNVQQKLDGWIFALQIYEYQRENTINEISLVRYWKFNYKSTFILSRIIRINDRKDALIMETGNDILAFTKQRKNKSYFYIPLFIEKL